MRENCLLYLVWQYLNLMIHPLHQVKPLHGMILSSEKLVNLKSPSLNATSSQQVELDFLYMPSQTLNTETRHQQQLAFSLQSAKHIITIRLEIKKAANSWEDFRDYSKFPILTELQTQLHKKKMLLRSRNTNGIFYKLDKVFNFQ